jgi:hypothetical protein
MQNLSNETVQMSWELSTYENTDAIGMGIQSMQSVPKEREKQD